MARKIDNGSDSVNVVETSDLENGVAGLPLVSVSGEKPVYGVLGIAGGGTGQTTVAAARDALGLGNVTNDEQVKRTEMGTSNGVATLGADGKVPASQLPFPRIYVGENNHWWIEDTDTGIEVAGAIT